jgi:putative phosphoesterase
MQMDFNCIHILPDRIGLIADTHNETEKTRQAIDIFRHNSISTILHAGDVIKPEILDLFQGFELYLVFGNGDNPQTLSEACLDRKLIQPREYFCLSHEKTNLFLFHGHSTQVALFREICQNKKFTYVIKGHTHFKEDYRREHIHVINPGALNEREQNTIAILDLKEDKVEFYNIDN